MPNYVRWGEDGATCFFIVVTYRRRRLFDDPLEDWFHVALTEGESANPAPEGPVRIAQRFIAGKTVGHS